MKRIVVFALILNAALLGVIAQQFIALAGDDGPLATRQNGDVNGDQILDMSDAVYLLIHLFNGGAEPVALADSPEVLDRLDTLEATQGALQQGLTDLEADLPELTNDYVMYATDLHGVGEYELTIPAGCHGQPADTTWFETPNGVLRGGVISEEDGRLYFSTTRESDLLVEGTIYTRNSDLVVGGTFNISGWGSIRPPLLDDQPSEPVIIVPMLFENIPAGEHYLEFDTAVLIGDCEGGCRGAACLGMHRNTERIKWLSIKYLR